MKQEPFDWSAIPRPLVMLSAVDVIAAQELTAVMLYPREERKAVRALEGIAEWTKRTLFDERGELEAHELRTRLLVKWNPRLNSAVRAGGILIQALAAKGAIAATDANFGRSINQSLAALTKRKAMRERKNDTGSLDARTVQRTNWEAYRPAVHACAALFWYWHAKHGPKAPRLRTRDLIFDGTWVAPVVALSEQFAHAAVACGLLRQPETLLRFERNPDSVP